MFTGSFMFTWDPGLNILYTDHARFLDKSERGRGKKMKKSILSLSVVMLAIVLCQPAYAADDFAGPWEKFSVSLGGFGVLSSSDVRIGTNVAGAGIDIDVEEALGVDSTVTSARLAALYRLGEKRRHRLGLSWFAFRRDGTFVAQEDFNEGDIIISAGDTVNTVYNTDIFKFDYGYSFFMDERFNLAVSAGLFVMPIELGISASPGGETTQTDITAPLPVVGRGGIFDSKFLVEWNVWEHWGFGAGLDTTRFVVEATSQDEDVPGVDFIGRIKMSYFGLMLYAKYRF
jgi:hypothetical protein